MPSETDDLTQQTPGQPDPLSGHGPLHIRYARGELIHQAGSYVAGIAFIVSGIASESYGKNPEGRASALEALGPGDLIGIEALFPGSASLHAGCARAITDVRLSFLERTAFAGALSDDQELRAHVFGYLARRVFALKELRRLAEAPIEDRLRRLLADLAGKCGISAVSELAELPAEVDRRVLTDLLGLSPRRVSRALEALVSSASVDGHRVLASGGAAQEQEET